jgi:hypothetical protein
MVITRGMTVCLAHKLLWKRRLAACGSRVGLSMNSIVSPTDPLPYSSSFTDL